MGGLSVPALAIGGLVGVATVLIGVQCGGLDRCLAGDPVDEIAMLEPAAAAEPEAPAEARLVPDPIVTASIPAELTDEQIQLAQVDRLIGGSFAAVNANDQGWLQSAAAALAPPAPDLPSTVASTTSPTPTFTAGAGDQTAVQAVAEVAPVVPLERPEPLEVSAYAETPQSSASVSADAERELSSVAAAREPAQPQAEPVKVASTDAGAGTDVRTVGGSGVTVRSGPGRSNGRVFALSSGEKVIVHENRSGWLRITDDQGREGWLYQSLVN